MPPAENSESTAPAPLARGASIGRFQLLKKLGQGGMGVVYLALDPNLKRSVAIKLLTGGDEYQDRAVTRFQREAQALAKLNHPGIVTVHETGEHQGLPFLVMDFVTGQTLEQQLGVEKISHRRMAEVLRNVALALDHAHSAGIIHRDVKPANVIMDTEGLTLLTDFGLARDETAQEQITRTGEVLGTPSYLAPEQISPGVGAIGPWTDIHALGAMLHRGLVGAPPFLGSSIVAVMHQVLRHEVSSLRRMDPAIPPDLDAIALKCLEKSPANRYASAEEVAKDLERFLAGEPLQLPARGPVERFTRCLRQNRAGALLGVTVLISAMAASLALGSRPPGGERHAERDARADQRPKQSAAGESEGQALAAQLAASARLEAARQRVIVLAKAEKKAQLLRKLREKGLARNSLGQPASDEESMVLVTLPSDMTAKDLPLVTSLPRLRELDFAGFQVTDADISQLQSLTELRKLALHATGITDASVSHLAGLVKLQHLILSQGDLTDAATGHLAGMTEMVLLNLERTRIGDDGLRFIKKMTKLETLYLTRNPVGDRGLRHLEGLTNLRVLSLERTQITSTGLVHLENLSHMEKLVMNFTAVGDAGLQHLKRMRKMRDLHLSSTQITHSALAHLKNCLSLNLLDVSNTQVTDAGLEHLSNLRALKRLYLSHTQVTDAGLEHLSGLRALKTLFLSNTQVTDAGVQSLQQALPGCEIFR